MLGRGSRSGYVLNEDKYVNMDLILDNYFFDLNFKDVFGESRQTSGYSMSYNEDILLSRGMILLKVSYIDSQTVDNLIEKKERLTEDNIYIEKIKFQIDGNNLLHMLALNYNSLQIILNFLAEYDKRYLTMILMKNKENISPLDITIENDSPKCTELMLNSLSKLDTGIYSPLIFERFNKLLEMNIRSFYDYLDSCFFQTIQMQNTKYLPLIHGEFPWVGAHRSCLIDELFREKYTSDGAERLAKRLKEIKQRQELEHKKKIEKAKKDKQKLSKLEMKLLEDKKNREMNFKSLFNAKTFQKEMKGAKKNKGLGFLSSEILEESKQESENLDSDSSRLLTSQVEEKKNYDSFYYPGADHTPASDEELESEEEESSLESDLDSSLNIVEELRPQKTDHQRQMSIIVSNMMRDDIQPGNSMQKPESKIFNLSSKFSLLLTT